MADRRLPEAGPFSAQDRVKLYPPAFISVRLVATETRQKYLGSQIARFPSNAFEDCDSKRPQAHCLPHFCLTGPRNALTIQREKESMMSDLKARAE